MNPVHITLVQLFKNKFYYVVPIYAYVFHTVSFLFSPTRATYLSHFTRLEFIVANNTAPHLYVIFYSFLSFPPF
jgi:hypothetical protein